VYNHEIRTGKNAKQIIMRAAQISRSEPQGPSYLIASREALEEAVEPYEVDAGKWKPLAPAGLSPASVQEIGDALLQAKAPVVVTTYLGRDTGAVGELVKLCESTGMAFLVCVYLSPSQWFDSVSVLIQGNRRHSQVT
jgi:acetolactate synthase-1/2/3 large subunit